MRACAQVEAELFGQHTPDEISWMGGESPIVETVGLGGFAQAAAFPLQKWVIYIAYRLLCVVCCMHDPGVCRGTTSRINKRMND